MFDSLYIAWRYLCFHKVKTSILISVITLSLFLPAGVDALVDQSAQQLRRRADTTPLLIGAKGSETELVLNSLYFESNPPVESTMAAYERIRASKYADAIPLHVRYRTRGKPIVGTTFDYFGFRDLQIETGRSFAMLGECVVGAEVARDLQLTTGETLLSESENFFDLAGVYPLKMRIVGVLKSTGTPDDSAVFVDIKTVWIIAGLGHGHQDLAEDASDDAVLKKEGNRVTANASVLTYTEITPENAASFHFHGDQSSFPLTGVIAIPPDQRSKTLLVGQFQSNNEVAQVVQPSTVMEELLATILRVRNFILAGTVLLGVATTLSLVLVFALSLRIRRQELVTMKKIGVSWFRLVLVVAWEILLVITLSGGLATALTLITRQFSDQAIAWFLL